MRNKTPHIDETTFADEFVVKRNKYERQKKFKSRANNEFREHIKEMYKHDFKGKEENMVILKYPVYDPNGCGILSQQVCEKRVQKEPLYMKYIELKMVFKQ